MIPDDAIFPELWVECEISNCKVLAAKDTKPETFEKGVVLAKDLSKRLEDVKTKDESLSKEGGKLVKKPFAADAD